MMKLFLSLLMLVFVMTIVSFAGFALSVVFNLPDHVVEMCVVSFVCGASILLLLALGAVVVSFVREVLL